MSKKIILFSLFLILLFPLTSYSTKKEVNSLWTLGNQAYDKENYSLATDYYSQIISQGVRNSKVYYNLGNAYFRNKNIGKALLSYRRAEVLDPNDEDIKANINYVKLFTLDKLDKPKFNFFSNIFDSILALGSTNGFTLVFFFFYVAFVTLSILLMFFFKLRRILKTLWSVGLIILLLSGITLGGKIYKQTTIESGVVIVPEVEVRSGPGQDFTLQFTGHEGLEFEIKEQKGDWYLIFLPNGARGWILQESCEII
jgi:tetratricopeptide (TPR) repeat protein